MKRKGVLFTLTAIILLFFILTLFSSYKNFNLREKSFVIENRITTIKNFISDFERDAERALYIASYRSILGMSEYVASTSAYFDDTEAAFMELVINGTVQGIIMNVTNSSNLDLWEQKVQLQADNFGIDINMYNKSVTVSQTTPWQIRIDLDFFLNTSDKRGIASWEKSEHFETTINIRGFEDPFFIIGSQGLFSQTVQQSLYEHFVNLADNDTTNLSLHIEGGYYIASPKAPSYLMRFEGNTSNSSLGIESLVDVGQLIALDLQKNKSIVDHIYWSDLDPERFHVRNMSSWVKLDNESGRLADYDVDNLFE